MLTQATLYQWLLLGHLVAAMVWVGGLVYLVGSALRILASREHQAAVALVSSLRRVGPLVLAPAMLAVVGFGFWMVFESPSWGLGQLWVEMALGLFAGAFLIGAAHQSRVGIAAERAARAGDEPGLQRHLRRWAWGMLLIVALLVVASWDMVFKPGL